MSADAGVAIEVPRISFFKGRWLSWQELTGAFSDRILDRLGAYVVARFEGPPPPLALPDKHVVYIGETHGRRASLRQRLKQFGQSAGFSRRGQQSGHYAAWRVPALLGHENVEDSRQVDPDGLHFAVAPYPEHFDVTLAQSVDARGAFPPLAEAMLLWQHVLAHRCLPELNSSGRQHTKVDDEQRAMMREAVADADIHVLLDTHASSDDVLKAATNAANAIAGAWGYGSQKVVVERGGRSVYRRVSRGAYLGVGQSEHGAWITGWSSDKECVFGPARAIDDEDVAAGSEGPVNTVDAFRELLALLWDRWR